MYKLVRQDHSVSQKLQITSLRVYHRKSYESIYRSTKYNLWAAVSKSVTLILNLFYTVTK